MVESRSTYLSNLIIGQTLASNLKPQYSEIRFQNGRISGNVCCKSEKINLIWQTTLEIHFFVIFLNAGTTLPKKALHKTFSTTQKALKTILFSQHFLIVWLKQLCVGELFTKFWLRILTQSISMSLNCVGSFNLKPGNALKQISRRPFLSNSSRPLWSRQFFSVLKFREN